MGDGDFYPNIIVDNGTPITYFIEDGKVSYIYYFNHSSGDLETSSGISVVSFSQESIEVLDLCMRNESNGVVTFKDCLTGEHTTHPSVITSAAGQHQRLISSG